MRSVLPRMRGFLPFLVVGAFAGLADRAGAVSPILLYAPYGSEPSAQFGDSVAAAGDFDNDSYDDIVVGAPYSDLNGADAGAVHVCYGGPSPDDVPDFPLLGENPGDRFGTAAASAGDVNGDGIADLIVGAPLHDFAAFNAGRAYIYLGGSSPDAIPDLVLDGEASSDWFGTSVACAGKFNADAFDDVIVGAPNHDGLRGRAYVYFGGPGMDAVSDVILDGESASDHFGCSVNTAGLFSPDAFDDVIVGANGNDAAFLEAGRAYVYHGGVAPDAVADLTVSGTSSFEIFGTSVSTAGDFDADGYADVIVGAPNLFPVPGRASIFLGGPAADATPDFVLTNALAGEEFGVSAAAAGTVDSDPYDDVVVGSPSRSGGGVAHVYVYFGGPSADVTADLTVTDSDRFGEAVAAAGNPNADAFDEFLVGAHTDGTGGPGAGRAFVYTVDLATAALLAMFEAEPLDRGIEIHWIVHGAGDASEIVLERAAHVEGPWTRVAATADVQDGVSIVTDLDVQAGLVYQYRLLEVVDGAARVLGSIEARAALALERFDLSAAPSPSRGPVQVAYAVPRDAVVRVDVLDVSGRRMAVLAEGRHAPGRFRVAWDGAAPGGLRRAGVYLVTLRAPGIEISRRVMVVP